MQVLAGGFKVSEGRYCSSGGFQGQEIRVQVVQVGGSGHDLGDTWERSVI
jgi:hypothetical protein